MDKLHYNYDDIVFLCKQLYDEIKKANFSPTIILTIPNGGLVVSRILAEFFNIERWRGKGDKVLVTTSINDSLGEHSVLVVDEICDSGKTLSRYHDELIVETVMFKTAVIHLRYSSSFKPDFVGDVLEHDEYVDYPWENKLLQKILSRNGDN